MIAQLIVGMLAGPSRCVSPAARERHDKTPDPARKDERVRPPKVIPLTAVTTPPADKRPYRLASATGDELHLIADGKSMTFRQVGWHGQTGAFYSLDEDPSRHEPGSFGPLWILVFSEPVIEPDEEAPDVA